jgi:hypothetical protein
MLSLGVAAVSVCARAQQGEMVTIRIRVDDSVRQAIPPIIQRDLTIEHDQSSEAQDLIRRSPPARAVPIIFIIAGAMSISVVVQMIREALRQVYYGGVLIDMRTTPPSVTSNPSLPGNMVFVIDPEGKTTRYTSDQLSPELLLSVLKTN